MLQHWQRLRPDSQQGARVPSTRQDPHGLSLTAPARGYKGSATQCWARRQANRSCYHTHTLFALLVEPQRTAFPFSHILALLSARAHDWCFQGYRNLSYSQAGITRAVAHAVLADNSWPEISACPPSCVCSLYLDTLHGLHEALFCFTTPGASGAEADSPPRIACLPSPNWHSGSLKTRQAGSRMQVRALPTQ